MINEPKEPPLDCSDEEFQAYRNEMAIYDAELNVDYKRETRKVFLVTLPIILFVLLPIGMISWGIAWLKEKLFGIPMEPRWPETDGTDEG